MQTAAHAGRDRPPHPSSIRKASTPVDSSIQQYLRSAVSVGRDLEHVGPFLASFEPTTDHPFLSYAIPEDGAEPSAADVAALRAAFERRDRIPRLEYLPAVAPAAEAALLTGGFAVEAELPLMTSAPGDTPDAPPPAGVELVFPETDAEIQAAGTVANAAFGEPRESGPEDLARTRRLLDAGGILVVARDAASGEAVGMGLCTAVRDGTTELAAISVREADRRRGIATAITAHLARTAFDRGVHTAFLTPGDDGAERVYERAGFAARSRMLHMRVELV
jgi:ribosomal protein S18 acetylase RimI-like enzyme